MHFYILSQYKPASIEHPSYLSGVTFLVSRHVSWIVINLLHPWAYCSDQPNRNQLLDPELGLA